MAHLQQDFFVMDLKNKHQHYFANQKVLDIGSLDINGSVKRHFKNCDYTGIDVGYGENVDIVCEGQDYDAPDESYDVVCSLECFEHNPYWYETFMNMIRLCKKEGLVFFTCATTGRPEHGTRRTSIEDSPLTIDLGWDYYRNLTEQDFVEKIDFSSHFKKYQFRVNTQSKDLYFYGIKF